MGKLFNRLVPQDLEDDRLLAEVGMTEFAARLAAEDNMEPLHYSLRSGIIACGATRVAATTVIRDVTCNRCMAWLQTKS